MRLIDLLPHGFVVFIVLLFSFPRSLNLSFSLYRQIGSYNTINSESFRWRIWSNGKIESCYQINHYSFLNRMILFSCAPWWYYRLRTRIVSRSSLVSFVARCQSVIHRMLCICLWFIKMFFFRIFRDIVFNIAFITTILFLTPCVPAKMIYVGSYGFGNLQSLQNNCLFLVVNR